MIQQCRRSEMGETAILPPKLRQCAGAVVGRPSSGNMAWRAFGVSTMWKWIGGSLAIVVSGVALFWFAGLGNLLYPSPPGAQQQSHTAILEFNIQPTYISDDWQSYAVATFVVVNDSDKAAAECHVEWFSRGNLFA